MSEQKREIGTGKAVDELLKVMKVMDESMNRSLSTTSPSTGARSSAPKPLKEQRRGR